MALLHIYDSSDSLIVQTANSRGVVNRLPISDAENLLGELDKLLNAGSPFSRILFETHGSPGKIYFGNKYIGSDYWRSMKGRFNMLVTMNSRIYFNGCNVAEDDVGWEFLETAATVFMTSGGGELIGQTSVGFGNPFNGHVVHLWGYTRNVIVDNDGKTKRWQHRDLF
jgi:hypothetical protein